MSSNCSYLYKIGVLERNGEVNGSFDKSRWHEIVCAPNNIKALKLPCGVPYLQLSLFHSTQEGLEEMEGDTIPRRQSHLEEL